ncbi:hypothetical protein GA0070609_4429 [Micromonospora echinaurantiaca]|uniref:Uncharacterized protein n=1 Tax=Micromonospora echinaurantiaca TaxID=47857 RepID=A0A1C5JGK1_9ACTN|nr:hypothetical protein [Micromonospora echinaurantiaca]SCG69618.1 hypothetical protein GA0070609_4429 [Micromonospora echinaurantiaca]
MATARKNTTARTATATETAAAKLAEARALLATREAAQETAEETHAELVGRLTRGDESVSALDLLTAEAEIARLGYLIEAAKRAVPAAERELDKAEAIDNPTLARWLAERIEADGFAFGLYGMQVRVTTDKPSEPGVYLSQSNATKVNQSTGLMSGRVNLRVITPNRATIDGGAILAGLAAVDRERVADQVQGLASLSPEGVSVTVDITNLKPSLPTLPEEINARHVEDLASTLAQSIARRGGTVKHDSGNPLYDMTVNRINWTLGECSVTKQVRDGDKVSRTIRAEINLTTKHYRPDQVAEYTDAAVAALVDEFAAGVGRIKAARVMSRNGTVEDAKPGQEFSNRAHKTEVRLVVRVEAAAQVAG